MLIVTGPRGAGKTTYCTLLLRRIGAQAVIGLLSRRLPDDSGYDLELYGSDLPASSTAAGPSAPSTRLPLARPKSSDDAQDASGGELGPWVFFQSAFDAAEHYLRNALSEARLQPALIVDEVGPLELHMGRGFTPVLGLVGNVAELVVTVRPSLVEKLQERLARPATTLNIEPGALKTGPERDRLLKTGLAALGLA